jgi:hypothetical protein
MIACTPFDKPLRASAVDGEVVVAGEGAFCASFVPQALLASLEPLRRAAEEALAQRLEPLAVGAP